MQVVLLGNLYDSVRAKKAFTYPKCTFSKGKAWFLGTPNAKIMRNVEDLGQPEGARSQSSLRVTSVFLGDLYDLGTARVQLAGFSGVL